MPFLMRLHGGLSTPPMLGRFANGRRRNPLGLFTEIMIGPTELNARSQ
jgi:hypothetical protein